MTVFTLEAEHKVTGGALIQTFLVAPDLRRIFQFRKARLNSIFGGSRE